MRTSDSTATLMPELLQAIARFPKLRKLGSNPDTRSKYVRLDDMVPAITPILLRQKIIVLQSAPIEHGVVTVTTRLQHTSGEWIESDCSVPVTGRMAKGGGRHDADPQAAGSAITYARRYGLAAALCLVADTDDDGRAARPAERQASATAAPARAHLPYAVVGKPDENAERLAQAQAYVLGSFIMPFGKTRSMIACKDDTLKKLQAYARDNNIIDLARDAARVLADRVLGKAAADTAGAVAEVSGGA